MIQEQPPSFEILNNGYLTVVAFVFNLTSISKMIQKIVERLFESSWKVHYKT